MPLADRPLRVALDARALNVPHLRGMGKYVHAVASRLDRLGRFQWHCFSDRPDLPLHPLPLARSVTHVAGLRGSRLHSWEQLALPWRARRVGADLLHCPATTLPWWQPVPTVVTLHDVLPWLHDEPGWPRGPYLDRVLPAAYRKCAAILTDSESSRRDIVRLWPALAPRVRVVPLGVDDSYLDAPARPVPERLRTLGVRTPYLLYLGGDIPRKRLSWALEVLKGLADPDVTLVVCGVEPAAQPGVRAGLPPEFRGRLCFAPFVAEEEMPLLYLNAAAVLYPTLYEGFGLPVLEAQAVGAPVLHSAVGSLAELEGPASVVLPPDDLGAWLAACRRCLARRREQPRPDEAARRWARGYSWDVCAARHLEVYQAVARSVPGRRPLAA